MVIELPCHYVIFFLCSVIFIKSNGTSPKSNKNLQEVLLMIKFTNLESFIKASVDAIKKIIENNRNKKITVYDIKLNDKNDFYFYTFRTKKKSCLAVNSQHILFINEEKINISVIEVNNEIITIESAEYFGEYIESAELESNDNFLNEKLIDRIKEMTDDKLSEITKKLLLYDHKKLITDKPIKVFPCLDKIKTALAKCILFLWGPPGTGKTESIIRIINEYKNSGLRVLLLANSNQAVDEVTLRLCEQGYVRGEIVRVGNNCGVKIKDRGDVLSNQLAKILYGDLRKYEEDLIKKIRDKRTPSQQKEYYKKKLIELTKEIKNNEICIINSAKFVAATFCTACINPAIFNQKFDVVIVDEASMAYLPQVIFASNLAIKYFICVGDFKQLPSVASSKDEVLSKDIFEYCEITEAVHNLKDHDFLYMLNTQYRMHSEISRFLSENVYCGLLKTAEGINTKLSEITSTGPLEGKPIVIADTGVFNPKKFNIKSEHGINLLNASISVAIALKNAKKHRVGIITPYSNQADLINRLLSAALPEHKEKINVSCETVHKFQGSEEDIIIFDSVDCRSFGKPGYLLKSTENNISQRLFNVSMSRAKGKFVFVGDVSFLKGNLPQDNLIHKFLNVFSQPEMQMGKNQIIDYLIESTQYNFNVYNSKVFDNIVNEHMEKAQSEINLFFNNYNNDFNDIIDKIDPNGVNIKIISSNPMDIPLYVEHKTDPTIKEDIIIIDCETVIYNAIPEENISVAINSKFLAMILRDYIGIKNQMLL